MNNYPIITPQTIYNFRQDNPELIIKDAQEYLGLNEIQCEILRKILLARGVNKWLKVRRDLIAYKKQIKHEVRAIVELRQTSYEAKKQFLPLLKFAESVRRTLRQLCKTNRWQIWPQLGSHHRELRSMNSLWASD